MDGAEFVKGRNSDIDIVIVDSTDIVGFAKSLFTEEFLYFHKKLPDRKRHVRNAF